MNLKALFGILVVALLMGTVAYVSIENQTILSSLVAFPGSVSLPVYLVIMTAFVTGFMVAFGFSLVRSSMMAWGRWRHSREHRAQEKTDSLLAQGYAALAGGTPDKAQAMLQRVLERDDQHVGAHMALGRLHREAGRSREALRHHREALRLSPASQLEPLLELAADHEASGDTQQAVEDLEQAISIYPKDSTTARRRLRDIHIERGEFQEAFALHEALSAEQGENEKDEQLGLGLRYELALEHQKEGRLKESEKQLKLIIKQDPAFVPAALALGEQQVTSGQTEEGVATWIRGFEASANHVFLARIEDHFLEREDPNAAIETLKGVAGAAGDRTLATFYLGKIYLRLEMIDEAEVTFGSLGEVASNSATLRYYQGKILTRRGQHKDAADLYRSLIRDSGLLELRYACGACGQLSDKWRARCASCGAWGRLDGVLEDGLARSSEERTPASAKAWAEGA